MKNLAERLFQKSFIRYLFGLAMVTIAFFLRLMLEPLTGTGAPFVLFFGALLVTSIFAGVGPGVGALAVSLPLAAYIFVVRAGHSYSHAAFQGLLYVIDGVLVLYLTTRADKARRTAQRGNQELRRANEQVTQAASHTREIIELAPDAFFLADLDARFTDVNGAACKMLGYEREELVGKTIFDIIPADDAARLRRVKAELLVPGKVDRAEWVLLPKDGTPIPVEVSSNMLPGERWQAFVRDITDRRRLEDETRRMYDQLRESEERFRLTIDEAPIGKALVALDGRFVRVNRALCDIVGYESDELTALTFQAITHPDDIDKDVALLGRLARGEIPRYQLAKRYVRKDGSIVETRLHRSILRARDGSPLYYIVQIEDVTERNRAEEALRLSEAKFSGIISISADAIISIDEEQRITLFNNGAEKIFGYSRKEVVGESLDILIPERLRGIHREHLRKFVQGMPIARRMGERGATIVGLRKSGEEFPADAAISKLEVGGTVILTVALRDITEQQRREREVQRAVYMRDQVLGIVAHDLRNPLTTIVMQLSALRRRDQDLERRNRKPLELISRAANRMDHLIQDLLDVSLLEAGKLKVGREPLPTAQLVTEAVEMQRSLAASADLEVRLEVARDLPEVRVDHHRLLQVFENLIGNAIKFTEAGGRITIGASSREGEVVFWVTDTGAGIAPENLPHVFDRFWQAASSARSLGAGLGLPITKGIVEAHGGHIWVESTPGRGSTFFFSIPRGWPETDRAPYVVH